MRAAMARALAPPVFVGYDGTLVPARFVDRRDRFVATAVLEHGISVEAHCINPGRMEAFVEPGACVWLLPQQGEKRKLKWSWEAIERTSITGSPIMCSTNTVRPNTLVKAALEARVLLGLDSWVSLKAEPKFEAALPDGETHSGRADFLLLSDDAGGERQHFVEVKNCHLVYGDGFGYFPDSVSERASRHMEALSALVRQGCRADVIFVVQRADVLHGVRPSAFHDPQFAEAARRASKAGVRFRALRAEVALDGTRLTHELPVDMSGEMDSATTIAAVEAAWEANRPTTGWTRGSSGARVANSPFAHHIAARRSAKQRAKEQSSGEDPTQPQAKQEVTGLKSKFAAPQDVTKRVESEAKRRSEDEVRTTAVSSKHEEAASTQVRAASKAEPIKRKKSRFFVD